jgi:hypothetical protein
VRPPPDTGAASIPAIPGRYPQFSSRIVAPGEIARLSCFELKIARNEIFARYGYKFHDQDLIDHFTTQPWYHPVATDVSLSPTELTNVDGLRTAERKKGC